MAAYRPPGNPLCPHCRNPHFPFCGTPLPMPQFHGQHPNLGRPLFRPLIPMDLPGMIHTNNNAFPHGRPIEHQRPLHPPQPFHTGGTHPPFVTDGPRHPSFGMGNLRPPDGMCRDDLFGRNPSLPPFHVDHERAIAGLGNPLTIDRKRKHGNSFVNNNEWKLSGNWPKGPLSEEASNHNNASRGFQERTPIDIPIPLNAFNGSNPVLLKGEFSSNVKEDGDGKKPSINRDFHHPPPSNNNSWNPYSNLDQTAYRSSFEERGMSYEARTFLSKDEEFLIQRGLQASEKKQRLSREEELLIEHGLLQGMESPARSSISQVGGGYGGGLETTGRMHQNSQADQFSVHLHQERHSSFEQMGNPRLPEQGQFGHLESRDRHEGGGRVIRGTENVHASNGGRFPNAGWDNNSRDILLPPPPPPPSHALSDLGLLQHGQSHLPERNEEFLHAWDSSGNRESIHIHRQREEEGSEQGLMNSGLYMRRQPFHTNRHDTNLGYPDRNSEEKSNQFLPTIRQSETAFDPQSNTILGPAGQQMPPHWNRESRHLQFPTDTALRNPHLDVGLQTLRKSELPPPSYQGREHFDCPNNRQYEQNQQHQLPSDSPRWRIEFLEHLQQKQPQQEHLYHRDATITTMPSEARSLNRNTNMITPPSSLPFFVSQQDPLARISSLPHTINPNNLPIPPLPSSPPPLPPPGPMLSSPPLPLSAPLPLAPASYTQDASDRQQFDKDLQSHHKSFHSQPHLCNSPVRHQNHQPSLPEVQSSNQIGSQFVNRMPVGQHGNHLSSSSKPQRQQEKSKVVDAATIFRKPGRLTRPDRFVVILRGLPGSGKSYLAKALRDVEVMNGGSAPRIHAIDDYFMVEVEKVEDDEAGVASVVSTRGKRRNVKKVMEYCYEAEMEEAYRASMFKAFRKTLEEGMFTFVIVDDRNLLVADFAQFWAFAKRSGYEVYILEAPYKDPVGCAARNVHGFGSEEVKAMTNRWEPTPAIYFKLDVSNLFRGDELSSQDIIEVEMDADDMECDIEEDPEQEFRIEPDKTFSPSQYSKDIGSRWADKGIDEEPVASSVSRKEKMAVEEEKRPFSIESSNGAGNALSGLMMAYGKKQKYVRWPDLQGWKGGNKGFSIGVQEKVGPLIIGPGPGYNQSSNPIDKEAAVVEEAISPAVVKERGLTEMRKSSKFVEQLRAEQEMFKAIFARRHHKSSGMDDDDD